MADAVKSEAADALVEPLVGARIHVGCRVEGGVKRGVEDGDLRLFFSKDPPCEIDRLKLQPIVRGGYLGLIGDRLPDSGRDAGSFAVGAAAVDDAMADCIGRRGNSLEGFFEIGFGVRRCWLAAPVEARLPRGPLGLLRNRVRQRAKPTFEAARPAVQDENLHYPGHRQSRISGRSSPCLSTYSLCSIRRSRRTCLA